MKSATEKEGEAPVQETEKPDVATPERQKSKRRQKGAKTKPSAVNYPLDSRINDYSFLRFPKRLLEDLGWTNGMDLQINKNDDGSIVVKKA